MPASVPAFSLSSPHSQIYIPFISSRLQPWLALFLRPPCYRLPRKELLAGQVAADRSDVRCPFSRGQSKFGTYVVQRSWPDETDLFLRSRPYCRLRTVKSGSSQPVRQARFWLARALNTARKSPWNERFPRTPDPSRDRKGAVASPFFPQPNLALRMNTDEKPNLCPTVCMCGRKRSYCAAVGAGCVFPFPGFG